MKPDPSTGAIRPGDESGGRRTPRVPASERRLIHIGWFLTAVFLLLAFRLWNLQVREFNHYEEMAVGNYIREVRIPAVRGKILDRHERPLADNRAAYNILLHRETGKRGFPIFMEQAERLSELLEVDPDKFLEQVPYIPRDRFKNALVARDVSFETMLAVQENRLDLEDVRVSVDPQRVYPFGSSAAHLVGFMNEIGKTELERQREEVYQMGDRIGRAGLEAFYEADLRGEAGEETVVVSAHEIQRESLERIEPRTGNSLQITLDAELQAYCAELLGASRGAIVALEPKTGAVLAMVSYPSYDPYRPVGSQVNRALTGLYPPASTFKMVTATAVLEEKIVNTSTIHACPGYYGPNMKGCWVWDKRKSSTPRWHGEFNIYEALQRSCDVYFYKSGEALGIQKLHEYAAKFGYGRATGIDLPGERPNLGSLPDVALAYREPGEILNAAIGQGTVTATPLQITMMTAALANRGILVEPRLGDRILSPAGEVIREIRSATRDLELHPSTVEAVIEGMYRVSNVLRGTGYSHRIKGLDICGKTGSAQHERRDLPTHAWFTCFAPREDPQIAVTVLLEAAGHGGSHAAPVAKKVLERWMEIEGYGGSEDLASS